MGNTDFDMGSEDAGGYSGMANSQTEQIIQGLRENPNNMSFWLPKFEDRGFYIPRTVIIPLTEKWLKWLCSDHYELERIDEFTAWIIGKLNDIHFNIQGDWFVKTGNFSNKFCFRFCHLKELKNIGRQFLDVFYGGMCVGCEISPEICVREFIHTDYQRPSIYEGMKLNTEFRVFYNFENKRIAGIFNYWDRETMQNHLYSPKELANFNSCIDEIEKDFYNLRDDLAEHVSEKMADVPLHGIWSVDFLWDGDKFWLIDAAIGSQSYYFDKLQKNEEVRADD